MKPLIAIAALLLSTQTAQACGVESDCEVPGGFYRIDMPDGGPTGAILFAHGYRGTASGTMRNARLRQMATDQGLAFVALDAGPGDDWRLPNAPGQNASDGQANFDYVAAVVDDLKTEYGFGNDRIMITGFSAGGMLVWNLACARPDLAGGFAPVAGTFWLEPPATCTTPAASIIHMHGDNDTTVPITGRVIGNTRQGDVTEALTFYQNLGGFSDDYTREGLGLACNGTSNASGDILEFCQYSGGHSFSRNYVSDAWTQFIAAGQIAAD
ncbi:alpha/beta hydrolase family esterase [Yoonia sp. 2307UL14-13]|uniref:alpha/beta hydrolase family esterase n=1 Tax=Yoonia sp. 2307UL14-13 TaxID=3126506 RepID=UPI0030AED239